MTRVTLGASNLEVSPIAFGTWQLSPRFWGEQPKDAVIAAMRLAFERGVNLIDTADAYGDGYAETVVGEAIRDLPRRELVITTKAYNHFNPDGSRYPDLSSGHIIGRCEASLARLGVETIDLYLLHFYDPLTPLDEIAAAMQALRAAGKVREIGVSNHSVEQLRAQRRHGPYHVIQPRYSLVEPLGEDDILPYCQAENVGVMIYSPLHKGLLSGKYRGDEAFDDFRRNHPDFQGERFRGLCDAVRSLQPMAERYGLTLPQLILTATLMHPAIDVAVCGIKTPDQIADTIGVLGKFLDREDYFTVRNTVAGTAPQKVTDAKGAVK